MARKAETYRGARRNAARAAGKLGTWTINNVATPHTYDRLTRRAILRTVWSRRQKEAQEAVS